MDNKEEYDDSIEEIIKESMDNNPIMIISVDKDGSVALMTTGNITKIQNDTCTKMLITVGSHSIVLSIVLWLEISFEKFLYNCSEFIKKFKSH